jgi:Holliday junction resolvase RusA-like endonuclease
MTAQLELDLPDGLLSARDTDTGPPEAEIVIVVFGEPAPQGSKSPKGTYTDANGRQRARMVESSAKVKPWRVAVAAAAMDVVGDRPLLDGPLAASLTLTVKSQPASKPSWWPAGQRWSKTMLWRPASTPDLSKMLRATEDALTGIVWKDDARVVQYDRLAKYYCDHPGVDVLSRPGAVIRVRRIGGAK